MSTYLFDLPEIKIIFGYGTKELLLWQVYFYGVLFTGNAKELIEM